MSLLTSAQIGYPKLILFEQDTVVALTQKQLSIVNYNKISFDECEALKRSLNNQVQYLNESLDVSKQIEAECLVQVATQREIIDQYSLQVELLEENTRKLRAKLKLSKSLRYIWTGIGAVGGFYIGYKVLK